MDFKASPYVDEDLLASCLCNVNLLLWSKFRSNRYDSHHTGIPWQCRYFAAIALKPSMFDSKVQRYYVLPCPICHALSYMPCFVIYTTTTNSSLVLDSTHGVCVLSACIRAGSGCPCLVLPLLLQRGYVVVYVM